LPQQPSEAVLVPGELDFQEDRSFREFDDVLESGGGSRLDRLDEFVQAFAEPAMFCQVLA